LVVVAAVGAAVGIVLLTADGLSNTAFAERAAWRVRR
jgi:hypothetical protein